MENLEKARAIISKNIYATIATVSNDGKPWNTPIFCAYDKQYNFYWGSCRDSQHSKNIKATGGAFLVIYDSAAPAGMGSGVYLEAAAKELEDFKKIEFAHGLLQARRPVPYWRLEQVTGDSPVRLYVARPKKVWVSGQGEANGTYVDTRIEVDLLSRAKPPELDK